MRPKKSLIFVDTGLAGRGGHHDSVAISVSKHFAYNDMLNQVCIYGHETTPPSLIKQSKNVELIPFFATEHYGYLSKEHSKLDLADYVNGLAVEYKKVLSHHNAPLQEGEGCLIVFHSLDYVHAEALSLALSLTRLPEKTKILAMQMYHPFRSVRQPKEILRQKFRFVFGQLIQFPFVHLYASDWETGEIMSKLLKKDIPIHPCLLPLPPGQVEGEKSIHTLYLGDAKKEKGFLDLPQILAKLGSLPNSTTQFLIHYNLYDFSSPELTKCAQEIKQQSLKGKNISLLDSFLSENEITSIFQKSCSILINYNHKDYLYKSSGVIWLAAYYNVSVVFSQDRNQDSWPVRECMRLGVPFSYMSQDYYLNFDQQTNAHINAGADSLKAQYRNFLFRDFSKWIETFLSE